MAQAGFLHAALVPTSRSLPIRSSFQTVCLRRQISATRRKSTKLSGNRSGPARLHSAQLARSPGGLRRKSRSVRRWNISEPMKVSVHAMYVGPTLHIQITNKMMFAAAYSTQVAGHAAGDDQPLDLVN